MAEPLSNKEKAVRSTFNKSRDRIEKALGVELIKVSHYYFPLTRLEWLELVERATYRETPFFLPEEERDKNFDHYAVNFCLIPLEDKFKLCNLSMLAVWYVPSETYHMEIVSIVPKSHGATKKEQEFIELEEELKEQRKEIELLNSHLKRQY